MLECLICNHGLQYTVCLYAAVSVCRPAANRTDPRGHKQTACSNTAGLSAPRHPKEPWRFQVTFFVKREVENVLGFNMEKQKYKVHFQQHYQPRLNISSFLCTCRQKRSMGLTVAEVELTRLDQERVRDRVTLERERSYAENIITKIEDVL